MDIKVEPRNFNASKDLTDHLKEMFGSITKYNDQIISIDIYLESSNSHVENKSVKARIALPGHELIQEENAIDFITASQNVYDKLKVRLRDQKEKDKENFQQRPDKPY